MQQMFAQQHFNSIKVQLKHFANKPVFFACKFQFHKGTIKTRRQRYKDKEGKTFQFHKGTIKTILIEYD